MKQEGAWVGGTDRGLVARTPIPVLHEICVQKPVLGGSVLGEAREVTVLTVEVDRNVERVNIPVWIPLQLCLNS